MQEETQKKEVRAPKKRSRSKTAAGRQSPGKTTTPTTEITPSPSLTNNKKADAKRSQNIRWDPNFSANKKSESDIENLGVVAEPAKSEETIPYYHEQFIQSTQKIADSFLKTNEEIISLMISWCNPYWENPYQQRTDPLISTQGIIANYTNIVNIFVSNLLKISSLVNESILINMEYFKNAIQQAKERYDDLANACVNMTMILESRSNG